MPITCITEAQRRTRLLHAEARWPDGAPTRPSQEVPRAEMCEGCAPWPLCPDAQIADGHDLTAGARQAGTGPPSHFLRRVKTMETRFGYRHFPVGMAAGTAVLAFDPSNRTWRPLRIRAMWYGSAAGGSGSHARRSSTHAHNELMRRCLWRRHSERGSAGCGLSCSALIAFACNHVL